MRYRFLDTEVDTVHRTISRRGAIQSVPARAFDILAHLIEKRDRVVTREELLDAIWPDVTVEDGNLTQNVSVLRKSIGDRSADRPLILTVQGQGYRFTGDVTVTADEPTARRSRRWWVPAAGLAILIMAVSFAATAIRQPSGPVGDEARLSIAVLPIRSGGFHRPADASTIRLTDALIASLTETNPGLDVRSSSSVLEFDDPDDDTATEAGEQLDVALVLVGYVGGQSADSVAEFQLVDVKRDAVVWTARWRGPIVLDRDRLAFASEVRDSVSDGVGSVARTSID